MVEIPDDDGITLMLAGQDPSLVGVLAIELGSATRAQELVMIALRGDGLEHAIAVRMQDADAEARKVGVDPRMILTPGYLAVGVARYLLAGAP